MLIPIVFSCDLNYQTHLMVTIESLITHNKNVKLYIMTTNNVEDFKLLSDYLNNKKVNYSYIKIEDTEFANKSYNNHFNESTYLRFYIPRLIPEKKVIYLDSDIIVIDNLEPLFEIDINNHYIAGVINPGEYSGFFKRWNKDKCSKYINAGVLLINNDKILEDKKDTELFNFALEHHYELKWYDQDALNIIMNPKIKLINEKYNYQTSMCFDTRFNKIQPIIIHYTGSCKPWHYHSNHRYKMEYMEHYERVFLEKYRAEFKFGGLIKKIYKKMKKIEK